MRASQIAGFVATAGAIVGGSGCGGSRDSAAEVGIADGGGRDAHDQQDTGPSDAPARSDTGQDAARHVQDSGGVDSGMSSDTGSNDDVGSTHDAAEGTVIFSQPSLPEASGNFFAPLCSTGIGAGLQAALDQFGITSWQCPLGAGFVADTSNAMSLTEFDPNGGNGLGAFQFGYSDAPHISVAQLDGTQVGVYMDSADLSGYSVCPSPSDPAMPNHGCKMGMFPQVKFTPGKYMPFAAGNSVVVSFQKSVATAETNTGSEAYVVSDLLFIDTSGAVDPSTNKPYQFSTGEILFNNLPAASSCGNPKVDAPTGGIIVDCPMLPGAPYSTYFTLLSSAGFQASTWSQLLTFSYSMSKTQFANALTAAKASMSTATFSVRPEDYSLAEWHANDELNNYEKGRARLGVTTKGVTITLQ